MIPSEMSGPSKTMKYLLERLSRLGEDEIFSVSPQDVHEIVNETFPRQASLAPGSMETGSFVLPRSWHYDEVIAQIEVDLSVEHSFDPVANTHHFKKLAGNSIPCPD